MLRKSCFFDFLDRRKGSTFERFVAESTQDEDYIDWNQFLLANDYGDAETEYHSIRNECALFDVSPLRKISVRGAGAGAFFDFLLTRPVSELPAMRATYTVFCENDGNFKDDAILYKFADDDYLLMPSDIDHSPYFESLCRQIGVDDVSFTECTDEWVGLAIQGPQSADALLSMGFDEIESLKPFEVRDYELGESSIKIARMGFTADLGYECWFAPVVAEEFTRRIESARQMLGISIPGYGLTALQACRLEGGFIVAGWDCSTEIDPQPGFERSPLELGLAWLVNLDSGDFVGKAALLQQKKNGYEHTLRYFSIEYEVQPEDGATLYASVDARDVAVGQLNNSAWSWGLEKTIGNASLASAFAGLTAGWIQIDDARYNVTINRKPPIDLPRRNQVPAPTTSG